MNTLIYGLKHLCISLLGYAQAMIVFLSILSVLENLWGICPWGTLCRRESVTVGLLERNVEITFELSSVSFPDCLWKKIYGLLWRYFQF